MALIAGLAAVVVIAGGPRSTPSAPEALEGPGFATPEAAAEAYLAAMRAGDIRAMARTFAIETYAKNLDCKQMINRMGAYLPSFSIVPYPPGEVNERILAGTRYSQVMGLIAAQYEALSDPPFDRSKPIYVQPDDGSAPDAGEQTATQFYDKLVATYDGSAFTGIQATGLVLQDFIVPDATGRIASPEGQQAIENQLKLYRMDQLTDRAYAIKTRKGTFYVFLGLARYGDLWWLTTRPLVSPYVDFPLGGGVMKA